MTDAPLLGVTVITCSDRVSAGTAHDDSGPLAARLLTRLGFAVGRPVVVPDDHRVIEQAVRDAIADGARVVVCSGGTGLSPRDVTVDVLERIADRSIPGIGEAFRARSRIETPLADLSRAAAVVVGRSVVVAVPGSADGTSQAIEVAGPLLRHALEMIDGSGHVHHEHCESTRATALITSDPVDLDALRDRVTDPAAGAVAVFEGRVRDHDHGKPVTGIMYEGHPGAEGILGEVVAEAAGLPDVIHAAAVHRVGELVVGDLAFAVAISAPHRKEAIAACDWLVDEAKRRLPVWKLQRFTDGGQAWSQCP